MFRETADIETATADYASRFKGVAGEFFLEKQLCITLDLLADLPKARILDVGGGHAQLAEPLVHKGFDVTVTGSAGSCRTRLDQRLAPHSFEYLTCDSLNLPFDDNSFDVVMAFRYLPHAERWRELTAELCRVAEKCVIVDYPDRRSTNIFYEQFFGMKKKMEGNTRPYTLFSRSEIGAEFKKNGFHRLNFRPEFLLPMVIHRKVKNRLFSIFVEGWCRLTGATYFFGSPIIVRADQGEPKKGGGGDI
jgi:2-polyprenyl-3-methyl-5-hydroxy-6-metoxy-1,4-benzoquinol methylase